MSPSTDTRESRELASELKFLIKPALAGQIRDWARSRLMPDPNGNGESGDSYRITSLYFDTENWDVFHRNGSYGRSKYRIRRYGNNDFVFLERKLRRPGMLSKRRSFVGVDELELLMRPYPERGFGGFWFHRRILRRGLRPICQISYDRTARVAMTRHGPIRLTIDENLRGLPATAMAFQGESGTLLSEDQVVLELKFRCETPVVFKFLVEEFALEARAFSKYRFAVETLGPVGSRAHAAECLTPLHA